MAKIVFIVNSLQNQRCIKRIKEFIASGAEVEVFAYTRQAENYANYSFPLKVLGVIEGQGSYLHRFPLLYNSIKKAIRERAEISSDIYYLFGLDIAIVFRLLNRRNRYVYEESDLVHTYVERKALRIVLENIDKRIIRSSFMSVFTSEGFAEYHFGNKWPQNAVIIPNRLNPSILDLDYPGSKEHDGGRIRIGFVGKPRFKSVVNFAKVLCALSDKFEFHIYGGPILEEVDGFRKLEQYKNYFYHGPFKNPDGLPEIYSSIDLVLSTYDVEFENVRYAEPNKIYESMFFNTPIIVSSGTFLAKKTEELGIGFSLDPLNDREVTEFLESLTPQTIQEKADNCKKIDRNDLIDCNSRFILSLIEA